MSTGGPYRSPEVTIAIPTRDRNELLRRAVRSALAQTVEQIEVIVVDDGSVDPVVLDPDLRVTVVRLDASRGVCAARNVALARARGRWIAFLDDDDELSPDFAERAILAAQESRLPPPVAVLAAIDVVDEADEVTEVRWPITLARGESFFRADADRPMFQFANPLLAPVEVVRSIGGWDERYRAWEVEDFLIRLSQAASLQGISDRTYRMHDHAGPRLGGDSGAMLAGARLTLREYAAELAADRSRRARYFGAMAFILLQDGRTASGLRALWSSFLCQPRLPLGRSGTWLHALVRPIIHRFGPRRERLAEPLDPRSLASGGIETASAMIEGAEGGTGPTGRSSTVPRVSIGLVVFNGEQYLRSAIDSLLEQTYRDFELIISDNGSTDASELIARAVAEQDDRVRYVRHPENHGLAWNLNYVVREAVGEFFMWAGHDDIHGPEFIERCVAALNADPEVVYAYGDTFLIDGDGKIFGREINRFERARLSPNRRFWEQLVVQGGQNFYGIIRTSVLHAIAPHGSIPWAERVMFAELSLHGRFVLVPGATFYWRRHPAQLTAAWGNRRAAAAALDPKRPAWRRTTPVLMAEYLAGYTAAVWRAPLGAGERLRCYARLARWLLIHVPGLRLHDPRAAGVEIVPVESDAPDDAIDGSANAGRLPHDQPRS